ncbi:MAG TPA: amidohydrolase family protein [Flavihumibacter sp.]
MLKIDAHHHFWDYDPVTHAWIDESMAAIQRSYSPADLEPILREAGIEGTVLVQVNQSPEENESFINIANQHSFIHGVVGWIDLRARDLEDQLQQLKTNRKLKGFRHIAQAEAPDFLSRPEIIDGIRKLGRQGYTYDILIKPHQFRAAIELVKACDEQPLVLDHIAKPYIREGKISEWKKDMMEMAATEAVYCKLSGIITEADWQQWTPEQIRPYLEVALEAFGANRLMFGSDWPVCLVAGTYKQVVDLIEGYTRQLSEDEQAGIWGGNAVRFYSL